MYHLAFSIMSVRCHFTVFQWKLDHCASAFETDTYIVIFIIIITHHFSDPRIAVCPLSVHTDNAWTAPYRLRGSNALWFMCWFLRYINCLCAYLTSSLSSLLTFSENAFFLTYLLHYSLTFWLVYLLPEQTRSISRPEVVEGDQTWL